MRLVLAFVFAFTALSAADAPLPSLGKCLAALEVCGFKDEVEQIPATVIDVGRLKYVPYSSFQVGEDRELNVYGDPEAPACVEMGVYRDFLTDDREKRRCIEYLRHVFPAFDPAALRLTGGRNLRGGVVIEVTPPDAADAYGGWWISVYSLPLLHAARPAG